MIFFVDKMELGIIEPFGGTSTVQSQYLAKYQQSLRQMQDDKRWKYSGSGAIFTGTARGFEEEYSRAITGICGSENPGELCYAVVTDDVAGILQKQFQDESVAESHLFHSSNCRLGALEYVPSLRFVLTSQTMRGIENVAFFDIDTQSFRTLTGGDSMDSNPSFDQQNSRILFDSRGVGRDQNERIVAFDTAVICAYNMDSASVVELHRDPNFDLICPKADSDGSLYYIKKPYVGPRSFNLFGTIHDIFMFPFRMLKAFFGFLNAFTTTFAGEKLRQSGGSNPSKAKQADQKEILFRGNVIKAERKKNPDPEDDGFIPRSWQLVRRQGDAETVIAKGVGCFCLPGDGSVVYSNGNSIFRLREGKRSLIHKGSVISELSVIGE